jgi:phage shock protein PspC (stress-responsive transcriptional regulator)
MYCSNCGTQSGDRDNFCHACGREVAHAGEAHQSSAAGYNAPRRVYRLVHDKKIAGVCSGLAKYFDIDVTLVRLAVATGIVLSGGIGLLAYIAAWIIMPVDHGAPIVNSQASSKLATG